jgi:uncharacterized membrane protein
MRLEQNPLFRKKILPWYDSNIVCIITVAFLFIVFLFGIAGIFEAYEKIENHKHMWFPFILVIMSGGTAASILLRIIKRYYLNPGGEKFLA